MIIFFEFSGAYLVGMGAFLAGCGSVLSGVAALKAAHRGGDDAETKPRRVSKRKSRARHGRGVPRIHGPRHREHPTSSEDGHD